MYKYHKKIPGALVIRKLKKEVTIDSGTCTCSRRSFCQKLDESLEMLTFNHLIVDFSS